ncbi:co-chaperone GroES [Patescibacteria group bacterium]
MKIKPLGNNVMIEPITEDAKTPGGIVLPDTHEKEKPAKGKVLAAGQGKVDVNGKKMPMSVKKGDNVLFKKYSADEFKEGDSEYIIVSEEDIIGIIS